MEKTEKELPLYLKQRGERGMKTYNMFTTFRKNLPIIRSYRGLTAEGLGLLIGMRPKRISDFETGRMPPKMEEVFKLSKALEVTVGELMAKTIKITFE